MNKDIIYIDTEDDITAIIGKIKASSEKVVALVPPKRTGVLQSAVNLRLLSRMAEKNDKKLVLITNNKALIALSAPAKIPYAKNLQSKPEIAEIAALEIDDGEDIIDGAKLPIGELAKTADKKPGSDIADDISSLKIDDEDPKYIPPASDGSDKSQPKTSKKNKIKVPNFSKFRKKLFLGITAAILLIVFLVWAIWFAPSAKIIITAKTEAAPVSEAINLGGTSPTDLSTNTVQSITKQIKKDISVDFTPTGTKLVGEKANGVMTLTNELVGPVSVPEGTIFSSGQYDFSSDSRVTIPGASGTVDNPVAGTATVNVTAVKVGSSYNLSPRSYVSDFPNISAEGAQMAGGSSRKITIVTATDVQKASQALVDLPTDDTKQELIQQFTNEELVISDSFNINRAAAVSKPAVGDEATGKATLTSATTFTVTAISKSEMEAYLKNSINKQIGDNKDQRIYEDGIKTVKLLNYDNTNKIATVNVETTGQIGPNINKNDVKNQSKGKHYGDVQSALEGITGVESVDIKFSYFWVRTVPDDINKILVEFNIANA